MKIHFSTFCPNTFLTPKAKRQAYTDLASQQYDTVVFKSSSKDISNISKNFPNPINVIFADLDGTILTHNGIVPKSAENAIKQLENDGIKFILTTGRSDNEALPILRSLGITPNYIITQQGAIIVDGNGNNIYERALSIDGAKSIIAASEKYQNADPNTHLILYFDGVPYCCDDVQFVHSGAANIQKVDSFNPFFAQGKSPIKAILFKSDSRDYKNMFKIGSFYKNELQGEFNIFASAPWFCEIVNADVSKGNALKYLGENILGLSLKNAASLGDGENDIEMMRVVDKAGGLAIGMGNGVESLKYAAKYVTPHIDDDGFAKALNEILKNNKKFKKN